MTLIKNLLIFFPSYKYTQCIVQTHTCWSDCMKAICFSREKHEKNVNDMRGKLKEIVSCEATGNFWYYSTKYSSFCPSISFFLYDSSCVINKPTKWHIQSLIRYTLIKLTKG